MSHAMTDIPINDLDHAQVLRLIEYDRASGKLFWRFRTPSDMPNSQPWQVRNWNKYKAGREAFTANKQGYKYGIILGRKIRSHRLIWFIVHGEWPVVIDHINGDRSDNRLSNLRNVSAHENGKNAKAYKTNKSGCPGVRYYAQTRKWVAYINHGGERKHLGCFLDFDAAIAARKSAEALYGFHENSGRSSAHG